MADIKDVALFMGLYTQSGYDKLSNRIIYKKRIENSTQEATLLLKYENDEWVATAQYITFLISKPFWRNGLDNKRCLTNSVPRGNNSITTWKYKDKNNGWSFHKIEMFCQKNPPKKCPEDQFLCDNKEQCIPSLWKSDGISDCSDHSDEKPPLRNIRDIKIINDIHLDQGPKVLVKVLIDNSVFERSESIISYSVESFENELFVEKHDIEIIKNSNRGIQEFTFVNLTVGSIYEFRIIACNRADCTKTELIKHNTQNYNCGKEDGYKQFGLKQLCDGVYDCTSGFDEQEFKCQGNHIAKRMSLIIFVYVFIVLIIFVILKKCGGLNSIQKTSGGKYIPARIKYVKDLMCQPIDREFKQEYKICHNIKEQHQTLAAIIGYILSFNENKFLRQATFIRMIEVEKLYHRFDPQGYYKCIKERFGNGQIVKQFQSCISEDYNKGNVISQSMLALKRFIMSLKPKLPEDGCGMNLCGLAIQIKKAPRKYRSKFRIMISNLLIWIHLGLLMLNIADLVKDITFTAAVRHFDVNIPHTDYTKYFDFNINYVFIISIILLFFSQAVTILYWCKAPRLPHFLKRCQQHGHFVKCLKAVLQYIPATLPILLFGERASLRATLEQIKEGPMVPENFDYNLQTMFEERLIEQLALDIKIIEVVCETYGQLIIQSIVFVRTPTLIHSDYLNIYLGISFYTVIVFSMLISVLSILLTLWNYHVRAKQFYRSISSMSTLLIFTTWILLISTKLLVYVISFVNFPGLFFVPVLLQFVITYMVLSFSRISQNFCASSFNDRVIHCMVCCILPLAVSTEPCNGPKEPTACLKKGRDNPGFSPDTEGSLEMFHTDADCSPEFLSTLTRMDSGMSYEEEIGCKDQKMNRKSRNEMIVAIALYAFECFSVTTFSAIMYKYYHFESYKNFLNYFIKEHFAEESGLDFYSIIAGLCILIAVVIILSSFLIVIYYKYLHPKVRMFAIHKQKNRKKVQMVTEPDISSSNSTCIPERLI